MALLKRRKGKASPTDTKPAVGAGARPPHLLKVRGARRGAQCAGSRPYGHSTQTATRTTTGKEEKEYSKLRLSP